MVSQSVKLTGNLWMRFNEACGVGESGRSGAVVVESFLDSE